MGYCLPDSSPFIIGNPETSSRVTLATLGIVFQTNLLTNYKLGTEYWLPDKTSYQLQTWSAVWKTVPSRARVTRDAVSGFITMERTAVWKTVPPTERSIRVNPINPCSKKTGRLNEHGFIGFNGFYQVVIIAHRAKHPRQSVKSVFEKNTRRR